MSKNIIANFWLFGSTVKDGINAVHKIYFPDVQQIGKTFNTVMDKS